MYLGLHIPSLDQKTSVMQVRFAESRGAAAVVLYSDPADVAPLGPLDTYPSTVYAPPGATQLGSLKLQGDLLTPGYPAVGTNTKTSQPSCSQKGKGLSNYSMASRLCDSNCSIIYIARYEKLNVNTK